MKKYYHLFSNGADAKDFILDRHDYLAAFNRIGVCAANNDATVLAFAIEDTHVHILLYGEYDACLDFKLLYTKSSRMYISLTRDNRSDAEFNMDMDEIDDESYLKNVAAYTIIQPTKDGRPVMFYDYFWGTGSMYFRSKKHIPIWHIDKYGNIKSPVAVKNLSVTDKRRIFRTRTYDIPEEWLVSNDILLPSNYVDVKRFESIFGTHNAFRCYTANNKEKNKIVLDRMAKVRGVELDEGEMRLACASMSRNLFGQNDIRKLDVTKRITLAREIRKIYGISFSQLSRRIHMPETELRKYLK